MKRPYLSLALITLAATLLSGYAVWGQHIRAERAAGCPASCPALVVVPAQAAACCPPAPPESGSAGDDVMFFEQVICCPPSRSAPARAPATPCCAPARPDNAKLVEELLAILQETKSPDTFLVTVKALAEVGPGARSSVPVVIRAADRLGMFKDIMKQCKEEEGPGVMVVEAIEQMLQGRHPTPACYPTGVTVVPSPVCIPAPPLYMPPCCPPATINPAGIVGPARPPQAPKCPAPPMPPERDE